MPSEVVTSPVPRKPHHPSCISSATHRMLCMPLSLPDCAGHEPGYGITCYTRPDYVITRPAAMPGVQDIEKPACKKHLGEVVASVIRPNDLENTVTVTLYEGA